MSARIIDGKAIAAQCRERVREAVEKMERKPSLAVVLVGDDPASAVYVRNKRRDCEEVGIRSVFCQFGADCSEQTLLEKVDQLNRDPDIDGILVQLPLPRQIDEKKVISSIDPLKDVDAFHPVNVGNIMLFRDGFLPCTPAGIMEMLRFEKIDPAGKECVVIGRSNIVGKPMAMLLLRADGTVTVCHSRTENLAEVCRRADILVSAVGKAGFVTADMVKPGAVVIDVGMNRDAEGKLCGDVDFEAVKEVAGAITPVPGGVGPMTRAMLLFNTLHAVGTDL